jgi:DNA-binding CsgD family transcriptional regulator/tetratricopeptide (TPR) repeat protein
VDIAPAWGRGNASPRHNQKQALSARADVGPTRLVGRRAECEALDKLLTDALAGESRVLVLRGEAGVGKTALLAYVAERARAWRVSTATGVESEMELAYSGLHQLSAAMLGLSSRLPAPQQDALATVFGQSAGPAPDRFLVSLATLSLFAEVAEEQPLICLIDDAQWLDDASAQVLAFVSRRLLAERVAVVCATRTGIGDHVLAGMSTLEVRGLDDIDSRELLLRNLHGPLDEAVCTQIVMESHGNPLALLELPNAWNPGEIAGGFGLPDSHRVVSRIEESYARRVLTLPPETQLLLLAAAAEPRGDPVLLHRAAAALQLDLTAAEPAIDAGLITIGGRVEFAHPLVRSAAYSSASAANRHRVHRVLADATDPETDPDRRAWHRARATPSPDEEVAAELERSAGRAQARGGLAAAAAFLERATALTLDPERRTERALAAAQIKYDAGSVDDALALLVTAQTGALDELQRGRALRLHARIAFALRRSSEARPLLLEAARTAEAVDPSLARFIYLEALHAALHVGRLDEAGVREVCEAALASARPPEPFSPHQLLLEGLATRVTHGYAAGAPMLREALAAFQRETLLAPDDADWIFLMYRVASDLWDDETHLLLSERELGRARETGALAALPTLLETRCVSLAVAGQLDKATATILELNAVGEATGIVSHGDGALLTAALRGREVEASHLIEHVTAEARARGDGLGLAAAEYATALLSNGLGRYEAAVAAARHAGERPYEIGATTRGVAELVEAAARTGDHRLAAGALERLTATTQPSGTAWALGVEARSRALVSEGDDAEALYREAIELLAPTRLRPDLARAQLLYGEWLRREGRRIDARAQLRAAHDLFTGMRMEAFGERAHRELLATGEKARPRTTETRDRLTSQEEQIARLARDGLSNPEIGAMLFLSPRTVEWHLRKVFMKLGINSRKQLRAALN